METGKTIRGTTLLAFDSAEGMVNIVEGMYRNIAATPFPFAQAPTGRAPGIAGFVHESIRQVIGASRTSSDWALARIAPVLDRSLPPGPHREAVIAVLNGIAGDHLASTGNPLAINMRLRVFLPRESTAASPAPELPELPELPQDNAGMAFDDLFETRQRAVEVYPQQVALTQASFRPTGRLLILAHGLCMNDLEWTSRQHNHATQLAQHSGYTPVYVVYNSGRHISTNGRDLCAQLAGLLASWPVPVESISFIGFSMGGLVVRSALQVAQDEQQPWLSAVRKAVYIGTPHHGAVLERGGYWLQKGLTFSPYTAPLSALGRVRSDGITDLRHGNVQDADWQQHDEHEDNTDTRVPTPLPANIEHYAIAGTLSQRSGERIGKLLGDGLVHPSSATGRHAEPRHHLGFAPARTRIIYGVGHLAMLSDARVMESLQAWLGD
ncbi:MAG: GPI inositol-deacylase [Gammaproteobacteria bacterium]|nr:GPI inositol-deacylase [Gammaproteobacteria bacterium]